MIALHRQIGKTVCSKPGYVLEISCEPFHELQQRYPFAFGLMLLNLSREMARTIGKVSNIVVEQETD